MEDAKRTTSPWQSVYSGVFLAVPQGYKHPLLVRPLTQSARWLPEEVIEALHTSDRVFWISDCPYSLQDVCTIRSGQKHPDPEELPIVRSCLGSVPWTVRPATRSKVRRGGPAASPTDCEFSTGTHQANKLNVACQKAPEWTQPPRNFTHLVLRENSQLAAPVAVQFQNSEARLLQSHLEERGELFQNPVAHGRLVVALLAEALAL